MKTENGNIYHGDTEPQRKQDYRRGTKSAERRTGILTTDDTDEHG